MGSTSQVWGLTTSEFFPSPSFGLNDFSSCKCVDDVCRIRCYEAFNGLIQNWAGDLQFYENGNFLLPFISVPRLLIGFLYVIYDIYRLFNSIYISVVFLFLWTRATAFRNSWIKNKVCDRITDLGPKAPDNVLDKSVINENWSIIDLSGLVFAKTVFCNNQDIFTA